MSNSTELEKAINNAIASMEFEGFIYTDEERALLADFVSGKISKEALIFHLTKKKIPIEKRALHDC